MKWWITLALGLLLSVRAFAGSDPILENGGTIILRAHYTVDLVDGDCSTLVIVLSTKDIHEISETIKNSTERLLFRLEGTDENMRLRPMSNDRLAGRILMTGRHVLVVSREYAAKHGFETAN